MKGRGLIKKQIIDAWSACLENDYARQRINSERSLQASFWSHLNERLGMNRRLFIEPSLKVNEGDSKKIVFPDIVVCNSREVIAIVELKYLPRAKPAYVKDIQSLDFIAQNRALITVANHRYRGPEADSKLYRLSERILFVWAGIHSTEHDGADSFYAAGYPSLSDCYLELHAATKRSGSPEVYYYG